MYDSTFNVRDRVSFSVRSSVRERGRDGKVSTGPKMNGPGDRGSAQLNPELPL
jgi:hypothetical protein